MFKLNAFSAILFLLVGTLLLSLPRAGYAERLRVKFVGCADPLHFELGKFWEGLEFSQEATDRLGANPARQAVVSGVYVLEKPHDLSPSIVFSTLGSIQNIQGKISPKVFAALKSQAATAAADILETERATVINYANELAAGAAVDIEIEDAKVVEFLEEETSFAIVVFVSYDEPAEAQTFSAAKFFFRSGCLAHATISLPVGITSYENSIEAIASVRLN